MSTECHWLYSFTASFHSKTKSTVCRHLASSLVLDHTLLMSALSLPQHQLCSLHLLWTWLWLVQNRQRSFCREAVHHCALLLDRLLTVASHLGQFRLVTVGVCATCAFERRGLAVEGMWNRRIDRKVTLGLWFFFLSLPLIHIVIV